MHEALIKRTCEDRLVGHISRDATAIEQAKAAIAGQGERDDGSARPSL
jgi:hypothetical protein